MRTHFTPGQIWLDTDGNPINAHGGGVLFHEGLWYWYGEHKIPGRSEAQKADGGIHAYQSKDLMNWKDLGVVLAVDEEDAGSPIAAGVILERVKVVWAPRQRLFIAYFKLYEKEMGYEVAWLGVATATNPAGPFIYAGRSLSAGSDKGSGDFAMVFEGGDLYHLAVRKPDKAFCITGMDASCQMATDRVVSLPSIPHHTEAPALFRRKGKVYMLGSGSTGWNPNAARSFVAETVHGPWTDLGNPCRGVNPQNGLGPDKTFGGQVSFVVEVPDRPDTFIAMFDVWKPDHPVDGTYLWLPIGFEGDRPVVEWRDRWHLDSWL